MNKPNNIGLIVMELIKRKSGKDKVGMQDSLIKDIGFDSLDIIEFKFELEGRLEEVTNKKIILPEEEIEKWELVRNVAYSAETYLKQNRIYI